MKDDNFVNQLFADWCESAPYGDQVPDNLGALFAAFCAQHGDKSAEEMFEAFMSVSADDPMEQLFSLIFTTGASFAVNKLADAVYDRNNSRLQQIGLRLLGTLATKENDPNPSCDHQHIMHPEQGGNAVFVEQSSPLPKILTKI